MKYLVDANVLSEPTKPAPDPHVIDWLRANEREIAVDPVILGELRFGILILPKGKKRTALERWFDSGMVRLHCLAWDADTGLQWAELLAASAHQRGGHADQGQPDRRHGGRARPRGGYPEPRRFCPRWRVRRGSLPGLRRGPTLLRILRASSVATVNSAPRIHPLPENRSCCMQQILWTNGTFWQNRIEIVQ